MLSTLPNAPLPLPDLDLVAGYEAMMARPPREPRKPKATGDDSDGSEEKKEKKKRTPNTGVKSTPWTDREDLILLKVRTRSQLMPPYLYRHQRSPPSNQDHANTPTDLPRLRG